MADHQLTSGATLLRGLGVLRRAIRDEPRRFAAAVAGSVVYTLLTVASAEVVGEVVDEVAMPALESGRPSPAALVLGAAALIAVAAGRAGGVCVRRLGAGAMQYRLESRYRSAVVRRYLRLPLSWHHRHATGTLLSNANADVEAAFSPIAPLPFAVGTAVMLLAALGSLAATDWAFAVAGGLILPALLAVNFGYARRITPRVTAAQRLRGEVSSIAHESFDGAHVVKTTGGELAETARFGARAAALRDAMVQVGRVRGLFDPVLDTLPALGSLACLVIGVARAGQGEVEIGEVVSAMFLFTVLAFPIRAIGWVLAELPRGVAGWDRVRRVLAAQGDMVYGSVAPRRTGPVALRFENVTFGYGDRPVIREVSFEVPAGRAVAVVGATGAGKSTIAAVAARLVDPDQGAVFLDGFDLRDFTADALARTVGMVPQLPFAFDDTIAGNVALDRPGITEREIGRALEAASLSEMVAALPAGTQTRVGERGTTLSGGQRQRLALARALAGEPRLLILDDATSAVDPRIEAEIFAGLRRRDSAMSMLIVAYRRATIALADEVVYVEAGRVVAVGRHEELLRTVPGYADLVTAYDRAVRAEPEVGSQR